MNDTTTTSDHAEHARELHTACVDQIGIIKGIVGALKYRADTGIGYGEGLDRDDVADLSGALDGAYEAAEKAWDKLSELGDLIPDEGAEPGRGESMGAEQ